MTESEHIFCSDIARENEVPLLGTATRGDLWFMVEYSGRWESKAFVQSEIPNEVKDYLQAVEIPGKKPRFQLIKQPGSHQREGVHFFIGLTDPLDPRLYEYQLQDYSDILDIDLAALAIGDSSQAAFLRDDPLFLICTNGRRDLCCARYGPEIYQAMADEIGELVWQSSHIGGHNKAPNNLFFPHGLNYGRATPDSIRQLVREYQNNRVNLEYYRGRVCYDSPVQAAEHFWRQETGILELPGMQLISIDSLGENEWKVEVQGVDGADQYHFTIQRKESDIKIPITCTHDKLRPIQTFHRVA